MSPTAALKPCNASRCPELTRDRFCRTHARADDRRRGTAQERGYDKRTWRPLRDAHLSAFPLCGGKRADAYPSAASHCAREGIVTAGRDVHHIRAHKGDDALFLDVRNLETLCQRCHASVVNEGDFGRG
jgi:5-methylcytosine-specific restriction protein A